MATGEQSTAAEIGALTPASAGRQAELGTGEVGYLITGIKEIDLIRVGDTVTHDGRPRGRLLFLGTAEPHPMVFSGVFPTEGDDFERLRDALDKLRLNDTALVYEAETSRALGFGFRCGFLGLLHMEIVRERLEREYDLDLVATAPSVAYLATLTDGTVLPRSAHPRTCRSRTGGGGGGAVWSGDDHHTHRVHGRHHGTGAAAPGRMGEINYLARNGWSSSTDCPSPRSCSTSSTSSSRGLGATPRSTTSRAGSG